jgi:hypothetical protein
MLKLSGKNWKKDSFYYVMYLMNSVYCKYVGRLRPDETQAASDTINGERFITLSY